MWLAFALLTVVFTTVLGLSFRKIALQTNNPRAFAFVYNAAMLLLAVCLLLIIGIGKNSLDGRLLFLLMLSGLCYGLFQRYQFTFRKHIEASVTQTVVMPSGIIGYILAIIWLNESITLSKIFGYLLILIAALLVTAPWQKHLKFNRYVLLAFMLGALLSIAGTIDREVSPHFSSALTYTTLLLCFHALIPYLPFVPIPSIKTEILKQKWRIPLLAGINLASLFCLVSALRLAPATKVMPIAASNVVVMAIAAIIILKERTRIPIKITAALITFVGLILLSR